ncbi:MAG: hybrid sensor histidine kinase/response regulator [Xenococcaceae cyanobacterium MO_188.B32]|nr:hybrid sensor histidine kinase/response regulator [Xenococcaceae cyanobacterium MO_188.B32]
MKDETFPGKKILVVDDSLENLCMIEAILDSAGYQVSLAEDGATALTLIETSPPDLVLSDVMMPNMSGNELTKKIRQQENLSFIPILLITAQDRADVVEGLDAGADDFIRKPIEIDELLARVRSLLRLKHSIDEREQMAKLREDFVSRLTHDLRTPLVAADRILSLFQEEAFGTLTEPMSEAIASMKTSNHNLLEMTNTILEVYRYEAGRKRLTFTNFDVAELIEEVIQELKPLAEQKALALKFKHPKKQNSEIVGSRLEIRRLLTNLMGNALKFTERGSISISCHQKADFMIIKVQDTGCGISIQEQANLFERFRQGNHRLSGSGLGLHLVRQIVEAHQGAIGVESEKGKGSLFTVSLPCELSNE